MVQLTAAADAFQMLEFKMANAIAGTTVDARSSAYKAVPASCSTSAISSGLDRLFSAPTLGGTRSRGNSPSSSPGRLEPDTTIIERHRMRGLESVRQELDEYLEEPLETFSRIERVNGIEQRVVFDLLTYWQVR